MGNSLKLNVMADDSFRGDLLQLIREQVAVVLEKKIVDDACATFQANPSLIERVCSVVRNDLRAPDCWNKEGALRVMIREIVIDATKKMLGDDLKIKSLVTQQVGEQFALMREELKGYVRASLSVRIDESVRIGVVEELKRRLA